MVHRRSRFVLGVIAALVVAAIPATARARSGEKVLIGATRAVGHGYGRSWVTMSRDGKPIAVGVTLSKGALTGLPMTETEYLLPLPPAASVAGFNHVGLDWNPHGHIPRPIYGQPHFDFHFYTITPGERRLITARGGNLDLIRRRPSSELAPPGYVFAPQSEVPMEGGHWVNMASPEFHGQPFGQTLIYGFYNGRMVFVEPMATVAYLQQEPTLIYRMPVPSYHPAGTYYPTDYSIAYNRARGVYTIALGGFKLA